MRNEFSGIDLDRFVRIVRRRFLVILLCVLAAGGGAFALAKHQKKMYTATVSVLFESPAINQQAAGVQVVSNNDPQLLTATQIQLASLVPVSRTTAAKVGHGVTADDVRRAISVSQQGQTNVGSFSATYSDPGLAASIANTFSTQFIAQRRSESQGNVEAALALVQKEVAALTPEQAASTKGQALVDRAASLQVLAALQTGDAQIVKYATPPTAPSSPKVIRNTVIGLALGLLLGLLVALFLDRFDRTLKDVDAIEEAYGMPLLGAVPDSQAYSRSLRRVEDNGYRPLPHGEAEAFRMLRAHLRYFNVDRSMKTVLVTSAAAGDGKTTVACYLADAAASMGTRVLLLEADLRRPSFEKILGIDGSLGLSDVLISVTDCARAVQPLSRGRSSHDDLPAHARTPEDGSLDVLTAGPVPPNPAELVESHAMEEVLAWAAFNYDLVIIDTPPLSVVADAIPLLTRISGVVVVARLGKSTRDGAIRLRKHLESMGAPTLGVVANGVSAKEAYGDQYGYRAYALKDSPPKAKATSS